MKKILFLSLLFTFSLVAQPPPIWTPGRGSGSGIGGNLSITNLQSSNLFGLQTNYFILRPVAAQLPNTNFAFPDQSLQQGMLVFPKTNGVGSSVAISALFPDCMVSYNMITNTLSFEFCLIQTATNGPNASNIVFHIALLRNNTVYNAANSTNDVQVGPYESGTVVSIPTINTSTGTNKIIMYLIQPSNGGLIGAGESFSLKLTRTNSGPDTYMGAVGVTSARLYWKQ